MIVCCKRPIHSTRYLTSKRSYFIHRTWEHCVKEHEPEMILPFFSFLLSWTPKRWYDGFDASWNICRDGFLHGVISDFVKSQVDKHRTNNEDDVLCCSALTRNGVYSVLSGMHVYCTYMIKSRKDSKGYNWTEVVNNRIVCILYHHTFVMSGKYRTQHISRS